MYRPGKEPQAGGESDSLEWLIKRKKDNEAWDWQVAQWLSVLDSHMADYGSSPGPGGLLSHFPFLSHSPSLVKYK